MGTTALYTPFTTLTFKDSLSRNLVHSGMRPTLKFGPLCRPSCARFPLDLPRVPSSSPGTLILGHNPVSNYNMKEGRVDRRGETVFVLYFVTLTHNQVFEPTCSLQDVEINESKITRRLRVREVRPPFRSGQ